MSGFQKNGTLLIKIGERRLSIIIFSLFFSWVLAFPFEGQILYSLANQYGIAPHTMIFCGKIATFLGLLSGGFFVHTMPAAKRLFLYSIIICMAVTAVFFFPPSILWDIALWIGSFLGGVCVAIWGYFYKSGTPPGERLKTAAYGLIYSNVSMVLLNMAAIHISPVFGLALCILLLGSSLCLSFLLPESERVWNPGTKKSQRNIRINKPLFFLCLFIIVITINSGLMYQVINPAYKQYEWLVSWYWAIPYIVALFVMIKLPRKVNRAYILYVGIAMIGFAFLFFINMPRSAGSYLIVDTLMLGACGVYDLFWWSILGELLDWSKNPAKILGIGLSANVLGVLFGSLIGSGITMSDLPDDNASMIALAVVFITLMLLPVLHKHLTAVLKDHAYLTAPSELTAAESVHAVKSFPFSDRLTEREQEIAALLLEGKTNRMIAANLCISENTVKTHVKNIYSKLNIQSRMELNIRRNK